MSVVVRECVRGGMKGWIKSKQEVQEQPDASERREEGRNSKREQIGGRKGEWEGEKCCERFLLFGCVKFAVAYQEIFKLYVCLRRGYDSLYKMKKHY